MSFNPVLLAVTIVMFCAGAVAGSLEYRRLLGGNPGLRHDNIHRYSLLLWLVLGSGSVLVVFLICCFLVEEIQWILPVWLEVRVSAVTYGLSAFVSSFLFGMLIAGMIRHDKGGARRLFILGLVVILALSVFQWKNEQLIAGRLDDTPWQGEIIMQTTGSSCAAASAANIAGLLGVSISENRAAELIGTTASGSLPGQVVVGMRKSGFRASKFTLSPSQVDQIPVPAMLFVGHPVTGPESHAVALVSADTKRGSFTIWDPLEGVKTMDARSVSEIWDGHGVGIEKGNTVQADVVEDAWKLNRKLEFSAASNLLKRFEPDSGKERSRAFLARAISLMGMQPRTAKNLDSAYQLLETVARSRDADETVLWAIYYQARIDQIHRSPPDFVRAAMHYRTLIDRYPDSMAAQLGFVKLAILRLYVLEEIPIHQQVLADLESESSFLSYPLAVREFHVTLADAYLFFDVSKYKALDHLITARNQRHLTLIDNGDDVARIGNLAYFLERYDLAMKSYREFLEIDPKATEVFLLRERLLEMESAASSLKEVTRQ